MLNKITGWLLLLVLSTPLAVFVKTTARVEVLFSDGQRSLEKVISSLLRADVALLQLE